MRRRAVVSLLLGLAAAILCAAMVTARPVHALPSVAMRPTRAAKATSAAPIHRIGHARPGFGARLGDSLVTSGNWAGYDVTGSGFSSVSASWVQPTVQADGQRTPWRASGSVSTVTAATPSNSLARRPRTTTARSVTRPGGRCTTTVPIPRCRSLPWWSARGMRCRRT